MASQQATLRLLLLYRTIEQMTSTARHRAGISLEEVLAVEAAEAEHVRAEQDRGRAALDGSDRDGRAITQLHGTLSASRAVRLEQVHQERAERLQEAALLHRASRVQAEQMLEWCRQSQSRAAVSHSRRVQSEADDRYAARAAWASSDQPDESG